jgi:hypothetical protein
MFGNVFDKSLLETLLNAANYAPERGVDIKVPCKEWITFS